MASVAIEVPATMPGLVSHRMASEAGEAPETHRAAGGPLMASVASAEPATIPEVAGHQMDLAVIAAPETTPATTARRMASVGRAVADAVQKHARVYHRLGLMAGGGIVCLFGLWHRGPSCLILNP